MCSAELTSVSFRLNSYTYMHAPQNGHAMHTVTQTVTSQTCITVLVTVRYTCYQAGSIKSTDRFKEPDTEKRDKSTRWWRRYHTAIHRLTVKISRSVPRQFFIQTHVAFCFVFFFFSLKVLPQKAVALHHSPVCLHLLLHEII